MCHAREVAEASNGGGKDARNRCVKKLVAMGLHDRARVIAQATPHWFRHSFANTLRQDYRLDARTIAEAGMWESVSLVNETYVADVPAHVEDALRRMEFGPSVETALPRS